MLVLNMLILTKEIITELIIPDCLATIVTFLLSNPGCNSVINCEIKNSTNQRMINIEFYIFGKTKSLKFFF